METIINSTIINILSLPIELKLLILGFLLLGLYIAWKIKHYIIAVALFTWAFIKLTKIGR